MFSTIVAFSCLWKELGSKNPSYTVYQYKITSITENLIFYNFQFNKNDFVASEFYNPILFCLQTTNITPMHVVVLYVTL